MLAIEKASEEDCSRRGRVKSSISSHLFRVLQSFVRHPTSIHITEVNGLVVVLHTRLVTHFLGGSLEFVDEVSFVLDVRARCGIPVFLHSSIEYEADSSSQSSTTNRARIFVCTPDRTKERVDDFTLTPFIS